MTIRKPTNIRALPIRGIPGPLSRAGKGIMRAAKSPCAWAILAAFAGGALTAHNLENLATARWFAEAQAAEATVAANTKVCAGYVYSINLTGTWENVMASMSALTNRGQP
jgi:hypothetical protein